MAVTRQAGRRRKGYGLSGKLRHFAVGVFALVLLVPLMAGVALAKPVQANIVVDASNGAIISASNVDAVTQPASLTKMMTLYLLFEALQQGKVKLSDSMTFSSYAASREATNLNVEAGDSIGVETAILAVVVRSANDVATAIAERLGGTEETFADKMTAKAHQLGMNNTNFHNASGLPDDQQRTTARDMAVLAVALLRDFPQYYPYFSRYSFTYHGVHYAGHNRLLKSFKGADGIKTGYVRASGFNLVTSAEQNGRRLVGVVLGGETAASRDRKMASLIQAAFTTRSGSGSTLIAKAPDSIGNKAMSDAVAAALAEPAAVAGTSEAADDDDEAAAASPTQNVPVKRLAANGADDLKPILKPGTQIASLSVKKPVKQLSVDDQTTANVWKPGNAGYGIQVGAFAQYKGAQRAATRATQSLPKLLASDARVVIDQQKNASTTLYRARVVGLSRGDAEVACKRLKDCMVIKSDPSLAMDSN